MPRFVVLHHDGPSRHYDRLLDAGEVLKAWRLLGNPDSLPVFAEQNHDHRLDYLDYEGPLSDDRGTVIRWDFGQYSVNLESENGVWIEMHTIRQLCSYAITAWLEV